MVCSFLKLLSSQFSLRGFHRAAAVEHGQWLLVSQLGDIGEGGCSRMKHVLKTCPKKDAARKPCRSLRKSYGRDVQAQGGDPEFSFGLLRFPNFPNELSVASLLGPPLRQPRSRYFRSGDLVVVVLLLPYYCPILPNLNSSSVLLIICVFV